MTMMILMMSMMNLTRKPYTSTYKKFVIVAHENRRHRRHIHHTDLHTRSIPPPSPQFVDCTFLYISLFLFLSLSNISSYIYVYGRMNNIKHK